MAQFSPQMLASLEGILKDRPFLFSEVEFSPLRSIGGKALSERLPIARSRASQFLASDLNEGMDELVAMRLSSLESIAAMSDYLDVGFAGSNLSNKYCIGGSANASSTENTNDVDKTTTSHELGALAEAARHDEIMSATPGDRARLIVNLFFRKKDRDEVFFPLLDDMEHDYRLALLAGDVSSARIAVVRDHCILAWTIFIHIWSGLVAPVRAMITGGR